MRLEQTRLGLEFAEGLGKASIAVYAASDFFLVLALELESKADLESDLVLVCSQLVVDP